MATGQVQRKLEQGQRPAHTVREKAQQQLRDAAHIFFAYASADLAKARDLRSRILKLRRPKDSSTVFMASDSLQVGEDTHPSFILDMLKRSDLFVVVCGSKTAESRWVNQEVQQALLQRKDGTTKILPIILKAGAPLPPGIDFAVQGIHLTTLFPAIRFVRIALSASLMALAGIALAFFLIASQRARERDEAKSKEAMQIHERDVVSLRARLQKNADSGHFAAIDFVQRNWLLEQRKEAIRLNAQPEIQLIDGKLSRYATPELRKNLACSRRESSRYGSRSQRQGYLAWVSAANREA